MDQRENSTQLDGKYKLVVVVRIPDRQEVITAYGAKGIAQSDLPSPAPDTPKCQAFIYNESS